MLAPGEYLLIPVSQTRPALYESSYPTLAECRVAASTQTELEVLKKDASQTDTTPLSAMNTEPTETEPRSFLLIILTALGAIHS
jgi:hypothetical protein